MDTRRPCGAVTGTGSARGAACLLSAALLLSACAQLPPPFPHTVSTASPTWEGTAWGQVARRSLPADSASGFQLMPIASVAYGARLELAEKAQQTLDVQYYVLAQDGTGKRFIRALRDAARRGVRVRLLVDDVYTAGEDGMLAELAAEPHAEVRVYNLFPAARDSSAGRWLASWWDFRRVDHRMHNKLFVVDNALAVFGGRNIADPYFMRGADSNSSISTCSRPGQWCVSSRGPSSNTGTPTSSIRSRPSPIATRGPATRSPTTRTPAPCQMPRGPSCASATRAPSGNWPKAASGSRRPARRSSSTRRTRPRDPGIFRVKGRSAVISRW